MAFEYRIIHSANSSTFESIDPLLPCVYSEVPSGGNGMCV